VIRQSPLFPGELGPRHPLIAAQPTKVRYLGLHCSAQMSLFDAELAGLVTDHLSNAADLAATAVETLIPETDLI
jgi:hypothetical protein